MTITISKWGNSLGMRLPAVTLERAGLKAGDRVDAEVQSDRTIVIRAVSGRQRVNIFSMIDQIIPSTLPDAEDVDPVPSGREVW